MVQIQLISENGHIYIFLEGINYELHSEGCGDPGKASRCGVASIKVNGKEYSKKGRGIDFVALDGKTGHCLKTFFR